MRVESDLVVAPCGGMSGKSLPQAHRRAIDGPRLDHERTFLGDFVGAADRRPDDGDMAGLAGAMAEVGADHKLTAMGGGLRRLSPRQSAPALGGALLGEPFELRIGEQDLRV